MNTQPWYENALQSYVDCVRCEVGDFSVLQRMTDCLHREAGDDQRLVDVLSAHAPNRRIIDARKPLLGLDIDVLITLAPGTLGRSYAEHMRKNGLRPPPMPQHYYELEAPKYVQRRLLELHDVWHVALGFDTDAIGEIGIGAFNVTQLPTRFFTAMLAKNLAKVALDTIELCQAALAEMNRGYALGRALPPLFAYAWDQRWSTPLQQVRAELGIAPDVARQVA